MRKIFILQILAVAGSVCVLETSAQTIAPKNDVNVPLYLQKPDYPIPYSGITADSVKKVLDKVYDYLNSTTPMELEDTKTHQPVTNYSQITTDVNFRKGDFRLISYEWGVTYTGMLNTAEVAGDKRYAAYTADRMKFLGSLFAVYKAKPELNGPKSPLRPIIDPHALDDAGSMCAAMIKASRLGLEAQLRPMIENYIQYISTREFRLPDGTLARNRPMPNTLWLDDLYMSVPALAQMGKLTGETKYFDDAVKQVTQFTQRMFVKEKGLYMHGWVTGMEPHPVFHWARANGWAFMTLTELLDVLPPNHPGYASVLEQYRTLAKGLAAYQSGSGFWHQLIDRNDSYLETSATAIYCYCYARGINHGWIDAKAFGPTAMVAWNAVSTKVNRTGQVEGTCVGTGMGFEPVFYYHRPVNVFAAHGYGPVLLAGSEIMRMMKEHPVVVNESSIVVYK